MRTEITQIVNRYMTRIGHGKFVGNPEHPMFETLKEHSVTGRQEETLDGVCFEEAVTRCQTVENLTNAVHKGRVTTSGQGDWEDLYFHFRRMSVGSTEEFKTTTRASQKQEGTDDAMQAFSDAVEAFVPRTGSIMGNPVVGT